MRRSLYTTTGSSSNIEGGSGHGTTGSGNGKRLIASSSSSIDFANKRRQQVSKLSILISTVIRSPPYLFVVITVLLGSVWLLNGATTNSHLRRTDTSGNPKSDLDSIINYGNHSVAVLVPYRDFYTAQKRSDQYSKFVPHMIQFFEKCIAEGKIKEYAIYVIEQTHDGLKFNRGKLFNIGYDYIQKYHPERHHDILIFHDIDLLPNDNLIPWYTAYPKRPIHLANVWPKYSDLTGFAGGIISVSVPDFEYINGYPNNYWGWGGEDDAFAFRLYLAGISIQDATTGSFVDLEGTTRKSKVKILQDNNEWRDPNLFWLFFERFIPWKNEGVRTVTYEIVKTEPINDSPHATKVTTNVGLNGNDWTNKNAHMNFNHTTWGNYFVDLVLTW